MKINELILGYRIQRTNEEQKLLLKLGIEVPFESLTEREQVVFTNLERKGLVNRVERNEQVVVKRNEHSNTPYKRSN